MVSPFASGFETPDALAFDSAGNLYVANFGTYPRGQDTVSEVTPSGVVSTFATGLTNPTGLAFDSAGNLYVANDTHRHGEPGHARWRGQHLGLRVQRSRGPCLPRRQPLRRQRTR